MEETNTQFSPEEQAAMELGILLGQRRAFGMVAGRCSAAHAECLRKIREEKLYLKLAPNWNVYCERHLKISSRTADRNIALLKKHGTLYFEAAAITGLSPAQFERIAPHIQQDGIHCGGEIIALIPENAQRAIDAVAQLQAETPVPASSRPSAPAAKQLAVLEKLADQLYVDFQFLARDCHGDDLQHLYIALYKIQEKFTRLWLDTHR